MPTDLSRAIDAQPLVDHHVHSALAGPLSAEEFATVITEAPTAPPNPLDQFDSQIGFAIRAHCAEPLGLERFVSGEDYLARRIDLGAARVNETLLRASGVSDWLIDTGFHADALHSNAEFAELSGGRVSEVVRLETVAEQVVSEAEPEEFAPRFRDALTRATVDAVGVKTIIGYRGGFSFDPERPADSEVSTAAAEWLREIAGSDEPPRLSHRTLQRFLLWTAVDLGLPIQFHVGYGDPDLDLRLANPLRLKPFIEAAQEVSQTPIMLLHCYPFQRESGFLAQVYPHVYFDVGLAVNYTGARSSAIIAESLELAPFSKILYSSDAWGPAELHYLGSRLWRAGMHEVLSGFVDRGHWSESEAIRVFAMIASGNARRVYGLEAAQS